MKTDNLNDKEIIFRFKKIAMESKLSNGQIIDAEKEFLNSPIHDDLLYKIGEEIESSLDWNYIFTMGDRFNEEFIERFYKNVTINTNINVKTKFKY